ncbi:unnamed protein product, partial [Prorocentrum cordatum]
IEEASNIPPLVLHVIYFSHFGPSCFVARGPAGKVTPLRLVSGDLRRAEGGHCDVRRHRLPRAARPSRGVSRLPRRRLAQRVCGRATVRRAAVAQSHDLWVHTRHGRVAVTQETLRVGRRGQRGGPRPGAELPRGVVPRGGRMLVRRIGRAPRRVFASPHRRPAGCGACRVEAERARPRVHPNNRHGLRGGGRAVCTLAGAHPASPHPRRGAGRAGGPARCPGVRRGRPALRRASSGWRRCRRGQSTASAEAQARREEEPARADLRVARRVGQPGVDDRQRLQQGAARHARGDGGGVGAPRPAACPRGGDRQGVEGVPASLRGREGLRGRGARRAEDAGPARPHRQQAHVEVSAAGVARLLGGAWAPASPARSRERGVHRGMAVDGCCHNRGARERCCDMWQQRLGRHVRHLRASTGQSGKDVNGERAEKSNGIKRHEGKESYVAVFLRPLYTM